MRQTRIEGRSVKQLAYTLQKKSKEAWQLHVLCYTGLNSGPEKNAINDIIETIGKIWIWNVDCTVKLCQC